MAVTFIHLSAKDQTTPVTTNTLYTVAQESRAMNIGRILDIRFNTHTYTHTPTHTYLQVLL